MHKANCLNRRDENKTGLNLDAATKDCCQEVKFECVIYKGDSPYALPTTRWCVARKNIPEMDRGPLKRLAKSLINCCQKKEPTLSNT